MNDVFPHHDATNKTPNSNVLVQIVKRSTVPVPDTAALRQGQDTAVADVIAEATVAFCLDGLSPV